MTCWFFHFSFFERGRRRTEKEKDEFSSSSCSISLSFSLQKTNNLTHRVLVVANRRIVRQALCEFEGIARWEKVRKGFREKEG